MKPAIGEMDIKLIPVVQTEIEDAVYVEPAAKDTKEPASLRGVSNVPTPVPTKPCLRLVLWSW